jgi:hypothetical protein
LTDEGGVRIDNLDRHIGKLGAVRTASGRLVATGEYPRADRQCPRAGDRS